MEKRQIHFLWKRFQLISLIGPILLLLAVSIAGVYELRQNNLQMLRLREAVFVADKDNNGLEVALKTLQTYVTTHMNTTLPKLGGQSAIQLKYTYDRLVAAEDNRVTTERVRITNEAATYCEATLPTVRLTERAKCVQNYIEARPVTPKAIAKDLYSYDFYSPRWSSDLAGWLVVSSIIIAVLIVCRIAFGLLIRRTLRSYT